MAPSISIGHRWSAGLVGEKMGFDIIDQKSIAPAVAATVEYQMARSKTSTWMRKEL